MTTRIDFSRYSEIPDDEVLVPLTYRQKIICASALQLLEYDATWSHYNDGSNKETVQADVTDILYRFMCTEQDTEIVQNIIEKINNLQTIINQILEEVMGDTIITNNLYGCGCVGSGTPTTDPPPDQTPDPDLVPDTPPTPSTEPTPNNETYNTWLCDASHQASKNLTQFMINAQQASGSLEAVTDFIALQAVNMPFFAPYLRSVLAFAGSITTVVNFYPFTEIIAWLSQTETERACILYEATTPAMAEEAYINYIYQGISNTYGLDVYLLFRPALSLLDYNAVYTENSYSVTPNQDCSMCQQRGGENDPNSVENIVDWSSLGYCLTSPDVITPSQSSGSSVRIDGQVQEWSFEDGENLGGIAFSQMDSGIDVSGFAFKIFNTEGLPSPRVGGLSANSTHMTDITAPSSRNVFVIADSDLTTELQGANAPLHIITNFINNPLLLMTSIERSGLTIGDFKWIHECFTPDNSFYLSILYDYSIEPENWLISGSSGSVFTIKNGYYSNGQTTEAIQDINDGLWVNQKKVEFLQWTTDGTKNIRIKLKRISGAVQGSSSNVKISFVGSLSSFDYIKIMDNENVEYIFETTAPPQADTYNIELLDGVSGFMRSIAVYGCEEF